MKNIDKDSRNRNQQSDNTLLYALLLFLVAIIVGTIAYMVWPKPVKKKEVYDYKTELGDFKVAPTAKEVSKLIAGNRNRLKTVERVLHDKMRNKKLMADEKEEVRKELEGVDESLDKTLQDHDIKKLSPEVLAIIYSQLYEQGKILTRLKSKIDTSKSYEELWSQWKVEQPNWKITTAEEEEIKEKMNGWITGWYNQAIANETKLNEYIEPYYVSGRKVKNNYSDADVNYFRRKLEWTNKDGTVGSIDLREPPFELKFLGYTGFLTPKDSEKSDEGKETYGITISTPTVKIGGKKYSPNRELVKINDKNRRWIEIKLKKELFFNRVGYEEWINKVEKKEEGASWSYHDICFEEVVETIAHELAHAVINSIKGSYEGQEGGGHGKLFYDFMKRIGKMMRATPEFVEFEKWWDKIKK